MPKKLRLKPTRRRTSTEASSASTPSSLQPFILDQLGDFFSSNPPLLAPAVEGGHTDSTGTRRPGAFDKHMHDLYRLKRVVKVPSIVSDLLDLAQKSVDSYPGDLPPITRSFPTRKRRARAVTHSSIGKIRKEHDVERVYEQTTANVCLVVAGTLAYQLPEWSMGCLRWTLNEISPQKQKGVKKNQAVADGYLNVVKVDQRGNPLTLSKLQEDMIQYFPVIAIWEFKNLNFSDEPGTMASVVDDFLGIWFPWEGCEFRGKCSTTHDVGTTGSRMGYDAVNLICPSIAEARDAESQRDYGPMPEYVDYKEFQDTPRHILQQAWSEGVRHDVTIIIIQAGNREIICIRDRENQTLYVSDVIDVSNGDYRKLHTGIYIAAVRDAEDRTRQLVVSFPPTWDMEFGLDSAKRLDLRNVPKKNIPKILWQQAYSRNWLKIMPSPLNMPYHPFSTQFYQRVKLYGSSQPLSPRDVDTYFRLFAKPSFYGHRISRGTLDIPGAVFRAGIADPTFILKNASSPEHIARLEREYRVYLTLREAGVMNIPEIIGFFFCKNQVDLMQSFAVLVLEDTGKSLEKLLEESNGKLFVPTREQLNRVIKNLSMIHDANFLHGSLTSKSLTFRTGSQSLDICIIGFADAQVLPDPSLPVSDDVAARLGVFSSSIPSLREFLVQQEIKSLLNLLSNPLKRKKDAGEALVLRIAASLQDPDTDSAKSSSNSQAKARCVRK